MTTTDPTTIILAALNTMPMIAGWIGRLDTTLSADHRTFTVRVTDYTDYTILGDQVQEIQLFVTPAGTPTPAADPPLNGVTALDDTSPVVFTPPTPAEPQPTVTFVPAVSST